MRIIDFQIADQKPIKDKFISGLNNCLLHKPFLVYPPTADAIARCLYARMSDCSLHYHTPVHILNVTDFYKNIVYHGIKYNPVIELALWFHDAIYIPKEAVYGINEKYSADFMKAILAPHISNETVKEVYEYIIATSYYEIPNIHEKYELILDLDLSGWCGSYDDFNIINECIKQEFSFLVNFSEERVNFFNRILQKPSIYRTDLFKEKFEKAAKNNIQIFLQSQISLLKSISFTEPNTLYLKFIDNHAFLLSTDSFTIKPDWSKAKLSLDKKAVFVDSEKIDSGVLRALVDPNYKQVDPSLIAKIYKLD